MTNFYSVISNFDEVTPMPYQAKPPIDFYRAMHFSAKRGIGIACRLSVCLSVTLVIVIT